MKTNSKSYFESLLLAAFLLFTITASGCDSSSIAHELAEISATEDEAVATQDPQLDEAPKPVPPAITSVNSASVEEESGQPPLNNVVDCNITDIPSFNSSVNYADKIRSLQDKLGLLTQAMTSAEMAGIDTSHENITVKTVELFLQFSDWDRQNQGLVENAIKKWYRINSSNAPEIAAGLPDAQIEQSDEILDDALKSLATSCKQPAKRSKSIPFSGFDLPEIQNGYFVKQGRRIYPWSMNWAPDSAAPYFSQFTSAYIRLASLKNESTGISSAQKTDFRKKLDQLTATGQFLYLFLGHGRLPDWALEQYPEVEIGARRFTQYDVDHPKIREWWKAVLSAYVTEYSKHPKSSHIYMIANEPHWYTAENSWDTGTVSRYTFDKFNDWLKNKYTTIDSLNHSWQKNFTSFANMEFNVPVPNKLKSTASWYDWMRFNMDRGSEWFEFLCNTIKQYDPQAKCTIKLESSTLSNHNFERDHGIHREKLSKLQGVNGIDTKLETHGGIGGSLALDEYALHWQEMAFNFDFMKSISPDRMIFDSEWHGFSNVHWRHLDMPKGYIHSSLWLSHLYGLGMTEAWYWARNKDGSIKDASMSSFIGSLLTQPRMLNSYAQTMLEINNHSAEVETLLEQPRKINILYVEEAAIQTADYLKDLGKVYETVSFLGAPIAIKTASTLASATTAELSQIDVLLVPAATHASDNTVSSVKRYQDTGGRVIFIGGNIFKKNELGSNRKQEDLSDFSTATSIALTNTKNLAKKLEPELVSTLPAVSCLGTDNRRAWGVICRTAKLDGKDILAIVNVANQRQTVSIRRDNTAPDSVTDRISTETLDSDLELNPMQFRLLTVN